MANPQDWRRDRDPSGGHRGRDIPGQSEHWRGAEREREHDRPRQYAHQDYDGHDEEFHRRGWRQGSDYYGNDPERYEAGNYDAGAFGAGRYGERSAKAQGGYGGTQDEDAGRREYEHGRSFNDRWQNSYRGSAGGADYAPPESDTAAGQFRGRGPRGYRRSDERIREDACECLTQDDRLDASNIEVTVKDCEVTLSGSVNSRDEKRRAEDLIERLSGVKDVNNSLRVARQEEDRPSKLG
jgi:BON domain